MKNFSGIDTNAFKAFWLASETLNFTEAAKQAAMTQSGISQHVSRLEDQLGAPLFLRVNKKVMLTNAGKKLKSYVERYYDDVNALKDDVHAEHTSPKGSVSYAMPESCLMSPHFGQLLKARKKSFPELGLKVSICPSEEVAAKIIAGEINFGFVTKAIETPGLKLMPFCFEEYVLVGANLPSGGDFTLEKLKKFSFVAHPGVKDYFAHWFRAYFPKAKKLSWCDLNVIGEMSSLRGVIQMVENGMGVTVLADHCIEDQLKRGALHCQRGTHKVHVRNQIFIATLDETHLPKRVEVVIDAFMEMVTTSSS